MRKKQNGNMGRLFLSYFLVGKELRNIFLSLGVICYS